MRVIHFDPGGIAESISEAWFLSPLRGEIKFFAQPGVSSATGGLNPRLMSGTPAGCIGSGRLSTNEAPMATVPRTQTARSLEERGLGRPARIRVPSPDNCCG